MFVNVFYLSGKYMRHCIFDSGWNINDCFIRSLWLPYIKYCVADFHGIVHFSSRKAFRAVFEGEVTFSLRSQFIQKLCPVNGDLFYFLFALFKYLLTLCNRGRIVKMNDCVRSTFYRFKGFLDDMLSCLGQNLDGNIVRNHIAVD